MSLLQQLSPVGRTVVESFVRQRTRQPESFHLTVSPEDEMYLYHVSGAPEGDRDDWFLDYLESGALMIEELRPIFDQVFGGFDEIDSLLEFACGHGRFTRFLMQEMASDKISVSDIYSDAVEFQRKEFGVRGQVSVIEPADFHDDHRYDCILVCSLFSHLPERTFHLWLERLFGLLNENGVLIFTVHDEAVLPQGVAMEGSGIGFLPESESRSLAKNVYGTTFVSERFCSEAIRQASNGEARYARVPKGLWRYQDVYVVSRDAQARLPTLAIERGLEGFLDRCGLANGIYSFSGWAHDFRKDETVELVEVLLDGERLQICMPCNQRTDVAAHFEDPATLLSGWSCHVDASRLQASDVVSIRLTSSAGESRVVAFNSLGKLLEKHQQR
jgi:SAM-dependent methyltransferase